MLSNFNDILFVPALFILVIVFALLLALLSYLGRGEASFGDRFFGSMFLISTTILTNLAVYGLFFVTEWAFKIVFL